MLSTASQLAMKRAIESMFAWTSSRMRKPAAKEKLTNKDKDIFQVVMTPDRIPKFFIPSLDVMHTDLHQKSVKIPENWCLERRLSDVINSRYTSAQCKPESSIKKKSMRNREIVYKNDSLYLPEDFADCKNMQGAMDHSDPATRAALSLPHLPKVTTPYGFLALGESPNIRRKESLFFESDTADLTNLVSQRKGITGPHSCTSPTPLERPGSQSSPAQVPGFLLQQNRTVSLELMDHNPRDSSLHCPTGSKSCQFKEEKTFLRLMMKHFPSIKRM